MARRRRWCRAMYYSRCKIPATQPPLGPGGHHAHCWAHTAALYRASDCSACASHLITLPTATPHGVSVLQDNTKDNPASKVKEPQHFSKTVGDEPCQQLIVQLDRAPEVDNPGALSA